MLEIVPIELVEANAFVADFHRHSPPVVGHRFSVGLVDTNTNELVGVAIAGRPIARHLNDGATIEITRCCTDGTFNACSKLYAAVRRAAFAMGYRRVITYTRAHESGDSLRGAGFRIVAEVRGRSWNCKSRLRYDRGPLEDKLRWENLKG